MSNYEILAPHAASTSLKSIQNKLQGGWNLVDIVNSPNKDKITYPYGKIANGRLIFSASKYISAQVFSAERGNFEIEDVHRGTEAEIRKAFTLSISYFGEYVLTEQNGTTILEALINGSLFPNWEGGVQIRHLEFSPRILTLSTGNVVYRDEIINIKLRWEKIF